MRAILIDDQDTIGGSLAYMGVFLGEVYEIEKTTGECVIVSTLKGEPLGRWRADRFVLVKSPVKPPIKRKLPEWF
jgi:hypothetical protein